MKEPKVDDLDPELDDEALREAIENLRAYTDLLVRRYRQHLLSGRLEQEIGGEDR